MGVVVLYPQDCIKEPMCGKTLISSPPMKYPRNPNPNRANRNRPNRRKRSPSRSSSASPPARTTVEKRTPGKLVMGHVKILKRGEEIKETTTHLPLSKAANKENHGDKDLASTDQLGPDPQMFQKQNRVPGFYAGSSACIASPPPSSLPFPGFFTKKSVASSNDEATSLLLKVLRLDLA